MHDNPQTASGLVFALPAHRVIDLSGRDAAAFAQAQFMNDVAALPAGQWQWNGWLSPKGRVLALFALLKFSDEHLWLVVPDADAEALAASLRRFVFRSKVVLAVRTELQVAGGFDAPIDALLGVIGGSPAGTVVLDMGGAGRPRQLQVSTHAAAEDPAAAHRWLLADIRHGLPRLPASQVEQWTPQQLSLERLRGFSVKKGCYPGQEIVARTHFLGKAKRELVLLESPGTLATGAPVEAGAATGQVVCATHGDAGAIGLAVMPLERTAQEMTVEGQPVRESALLDGLAR